MSYKIHNINIPIFFPELENQKSNQTKTIIKDINTDYEKKMTNLNKKYNKVNEYITNFPLHKNPIVLKVNTVKITIHNDNFILEFKNEKTITKKATIYDFYLNKKEQVFYYTTENTKGDENYTLYGYDLVKKKQETYVRNTTGDIIGAKYDGVYYCKYNSQFIVDKVFYYNNGKSTLIYKEEDNTKTLELYRTSNRRYMIISREDYDSNQLLLLNLNSMKEQYKQKPKVITSYEPYIRYILDHTNNTFYLFKNTNNTEKYCWSVRQSSKITEIKISPIYHSFPINFELDTVKSYNGHLICFGYSNGKAMLWMINTENKKKVILLDVPLKTQYYTADILLNEDIMTDIDEEFPLILNSQITHISNYLVNMNTGKIRKDKDEVEVKIDPFLYDIESVEYLNRDGYNGTYLVVRNTIHKHPKGLFVMSYGSYNTVAYYEGNINTKILMDCGIYVIIPLVRGGGGFGLNHFISGRESKKINAINDTIDSIKDCKRRFSINKTKVIYFGRSAGGLVATNIYVKEPKLCGLIMTEVPYCDLLRTSVDICKPLVSIEQREFGNPNDSLLQLFNTAEITPFFEFKKQEYPKLYLTTGMNDRRVLYYEGLKFIRAVKRFNVNRKSNDLTAFVDINGGHIMGENNKYKNSKLLYALYFLNVNIN
jgi:oligopeptidase B